MKVLILSVATTLFLALSAEVLQLTLHTVELDLFLASIARGFQTSPGKVDICFPLNPWEEALRLIEKR